MAEQYEVKDPAPAEENESTQADQNEGLLATVPNEKSEDLRGTTTLCRQRQSVCS